MQLTERLSEKVNSIFGQNCDGTHIYHNLAVKQIDYKKKCYERVRVECRNARWGKRERENLKQARESVRECFG